MVCIWNMCMDTLHKGDDDDGGGGGGGGGGGDDDDVDDDDDDDDTFCRVLGLMACSGSINS